MAPPASHLYFDLLVRKHARHSAPTPSTNPANFRFSISSAATLYSRSSSQLRTSIPSLVSIVINMERRFSNSASPPSIQKLRGLLTPDKDKIAPELKHALDLLRLRGLEGLENHFLALEAFLKPWSQFRDCFFLLQPNGLPRASLPRKVKGMDVLWFYTNFSEGELRYDPRADDTNSLYTLDERKYGTFDQSHWGVEEYEKMMYAWLLQEFRVGKARNPFGFRYFESRNVCTAWEEVFKPIVNAVRDSYDVKGRMHYGRLAVFIEERYPSRLAFPSGNVPEPTSATPYRLVTRIRDQQGRDNDAPPDPSLESVPGVERPITKKEYAEVEKELRDVYPKYGQVVERPKFRTRMEDWLAAQKARAQHKKHLKDLHGRKSPTGFGSFGKRNGRESPMFGCRGIDSPAGSSSPRRSISLSLKGLSLSSGRHSPASSRLQSPSTPTKRKEKKEAVVPFGMYGYVPKSKAPVSKKNSKQAVATPTKSERHGKTRSVELPSDPPPSHDATRRLSDMTMQDADRMDIDVCAEPGPSFSRPSLDREDSDEVYSSIRNSNPFTGNMPSVLGAVLEDQGWASEDDDCSPMGPLSAIPKPLFNNTETQAYHRKSTEESPSARVAEEVGVRHPSYEGNGYGRELTPSFIAHNMHASLEHDAYELSSDEALPLRIPGPVHPLMYDTHSRSGSNQSLAYDTPRSIPWPGQSPVSMSPPELDSAYPRHEPQHLPWPGCETPPPLPPKNPARLNSMRDLNHLERSSSLPRPPPLGTLGPRIISKENIRAHLGGVSRESSAEDLQPPDALGDARSMTSTPPPRSLKTFNTHMFPRQDRKGTPVGAWMNDYDERYDRTNDHEMEVLTQRARG